MFAAADAAGVVLLEGYPYLFQPQTREIERLIAVLRTREQEGEGQGGGDDDEGGIYEAAYDDMTFRDTAEDGHIDDTIDSGSYVAFSNKAGSILFSVAGRGRTLAILETSSLGTSNRFPLARVPHVTRATMASYVSSQFHTERQPFVEYSL